MKLLRVGEVGSEIVAAIDSNNVIRDLSDHIKDLNPQTINEETLNKLKRIKLSELKEINSNIRIGSCISNPVDFLAIGLNYKALQKAPNQSYQLNQLFLIKAQDVFRVLMIK